VNEPPLQLHYQSLTGPRLVEIVPIKQMGKIRWHVSGNDRTLTFAGTFFDDRDEAKALVESTLRQRYGESLALDWQPG